VLHYLPIRQCFSTLRLSESLHFCLLHPVNTVFRLIPRSHSYKSLFYQSLRSPIRLFPCDSLVYFPPPLLHNSIPMLRKLTNELEAAQSRKLFQVLRTETQIFRGWSREELFALADAMVTLQIFKNDKLVNKGEDVDWMGILLEGTALVGDLRPEGLLRPGAFIGYMNLLQLDGNERHKVNIVVETDGYLSLFTRSDFSDFQHKQPRLAFKLTEAFAYRTLDVLSFQYQGQRLALPPRLPAIDLPAKRMMECLQKTQELYGRLVAPMDRTDLKVFLSLCRLQELQPDQPLVERNGIEQAVFMVVEGELLRSTPTSTEILGVGTVLGLSQFLSSQQAQPWTEEIRSFKFAAVVAVHRERLEDVLTQLPLAATAIYKQFLKERCYQLAPTTTPKEEKYVEIDQESFSLRRQQASNPALLGTAPMPSYEPLYAFQQLSIAGPNAESKVPPRQGGESQFLAEKLNSQRLKQEEEKRQNRMGKSAMPLAKKKAAALASKKALADMQTVKIEFKDEFEDALRANSQLSEEVHRLKKALEDVTQQKLQLEVTLQTQERKLIETAAKKSQVTREVSKLQEVGLQGAYQKQQTRSFADVLKEQKRSHRLFALQRKCVDRWREYVRKRLGERHRVERMQFWPRE